MAFAYDHTIVFNPDDRKWHLYGIYGDQKGFIHLTADKLTQEGWEVHDPFTYNGLEIWAPHIVFSDGVFYMFYTSIGVPREIRYAVSEDLFHWSHPSAEPLFAYGNQYTENQKAKDPMVFWDENEQTWVMYHSMLKDASHWVVGYSTSKDLINWNGPEICFDEKTEEPSVESPFVVRRGHYYYLLLSARPWPIGAQEIFRSTSPYHWNPEDRVQRIDPWHAGEFVRDLDGEWYLSRSSGDEKDYRLAKVVWTDGISEADTSMPPPISR
jgi:beta-fructofuranosidase